MTLVPIRERILEGRIIETDASKLPKWVLARVVYPICNCKEGVLNRNGRYYPPAVWEKVNKDPEVLERLASRTMYGMIEHPATTQSKLDGPLSHIVTKLWYDAKECMEWAEIDILDTPHGVTFFKLLETGSKVGVSTRAEGELKEAMEEGKKYMVVVPESYRWETLDSTADPSTYGAIPQDIQKAIVAHIAGSLQNEQFDKGQAVQVLSEFKSPEAVALLESIQKDVKPVIETSTTVTPAGDVSVSDDGKKVDVAPDGTVNVVTAGEPAVNPVPVPEEGAAPVIEPPLPAEGEVKPKEEPEEHMEESVLMKALQTEIKDLKVKLGEATAEKQAAVSMLEDKEKQFEALAKSLVQESKSLQTQRAVCAKAMEDYLNETVKVENLTAKLGSSDKDINEKTDKLLKSVTALMKGNDQLNERVTVLESDLAKANGKIKEADKATKALKEAHAKELLKTYAHAVVEATGSKISARALALLEQCTSKDEILKTLSEMRTVANEATLHSGVVKEVVAPTSKPQAPVSREHGLMRSLITGRN